MLIEIVPSFYIKYLKLTQMSEYYTQNVYLKYLENFFDKSEIHAVFNCDKCIESETTNPKNCFYCISNVLLENASKNITELHLNTLKNRTIFREEFIIYFEYLSVIDSIRSHINAISKKVNQKCGEKLLKCPFSQDKTFSIFIENPDFLDPLALFSFLQKTRQICDIVINNKSTCSKCISKIIRILKKIDKRIGHIKLFYIFEDLKINEVYKNRWEYYMEILLNINLTRESLNDQLNADNNTNYLIDTYVIGKEDLFKVKIFQSTEGIESFYKVIKNFESECEKTTFYLINKEYNFENDELTINSVLTFDDLMKLHLDHASTYLKSKLNLTLRELEKFSFYLVIKKIKFHSIMPLLMDNFIEEIFLDSPSENIYINHQHYGRCTTDIRLNKSQIDRLKSFFRLYSRKRLDFSQPSLKFVMQSKYFHCRFSADINPLNSKRFSLDIRKFNKNIFTLQSLIKNGTLDSQMSAFLYLCILHRVNLTVIGETDSGKTTLINAFDLITPKSFRKIYVEDVVESLDQSMFKNHQVKYKIDQLDNQNRKYTKTNQIKKLLHRSPDLIYLGEILTKEEAEAMFHCLSAGLKGFQTIHANDLEAFFNRILFHFNINKTCLNDLGIIILMKKALNQRRIVTIAEIDENSKDMSKLYREIFIYNSGNEEWDLKFPLIESETILKIKKFTSLCNEDINKFIEVYTEIFTYLKSYKTLETSQFVKLFHKITDLSQISLDLLTDFWNKITASKYN